jgi:nicotinate-nucleotide adenylyltransferase
MIGLLGGSFDPVHHGHLIVGRVLLEQLGLRELRFVPAYGQPLKDGRHGASAADRVTMVERAIRGAEGFVLERAEVERAGRSYSVDTLRQLRAREPGARFVLLVGADAARDLPLWREAAELRELAEVVAFDRAGQPAEATPLVHRRVEVPAVDISSTEIRRRVAAGLSIRYWVPDAVAEFIAERGLYRKTGA